MSYFRNVMLCVVGGLALATVFIVTTPSVASMQPPKPDSKFNVAMQTVLRHEGKFSDDTHDPGGATSWGISLRYLREEKLCENGDCLGDKNEIINLTQTEADSIYYKNWYLRNRYNQIESQTILTKILDFSINAGASQCHKLVKRAINRIMGRNIPVNGEMDTATIKMINSIEPSVLYSAFISEEEQFYRDIVKRNPELKRFLRGWLTRCYD